MEQYRIRITRQAREHLLEIRRYIEKELLSPMAAKKHNCCYQSRNPVFRQYAKPSPFHPGRALALIRCPQNTGQELLYLFLDQRRRKNSPDHQRDLCEARSGQTARKDGNGIRLTPKKHLFINGRCFFMRQFCVYSFSSSMCFPSLAQEKGHQERAQVSGLSNQPIRDMRGEEEYQGKACHFICVLAGAKIKHPDAGSGKDGGGAQGIGNNRG